MLCKGKFPREEGFLRGHYMQKMGLGDVLGEVSLNITLFFTVKKNGPRGQ